MFGPIGYVLGTLRPGRETDAPGRWSGEHWHAPCTRCSCRSRTTYRNGPYRDQGMRSVLAVPLVTREDLIGVIVIRRKEVRPFTDEQIIFSKHSLTRP